MDSDVTAWRCTGSPVTATSVHAVTAGTSATPRNTEVTTRPVASSCWTTRSSSADAEWSRYRSRAPIVVSA